jgi:hypothetical protein
MFKITGAMLVLCFIALTAMAATLPTDELIVKSKSWVDIREYGNDLSVACRTAHGKVILISAPTSTLTGPLACPGDVAITVTNGGIIPTSVYALAINGPFEAGLNTAFTGKGLVTFAPGTIKEAYPQWWGGRGNNGPHYAAINVLAINAALAAYSRVYLSGGVWAINDSIIMSRAGMVLEGEGFNGRFSTTLWNRGTGHGLYIGDPATESGSSGSDVDTNQVHDIQVRNIRFSGSAGALDNIHVFNSSVELENIYTAIAGRWGIYLDKWWGSSIEKLVAQENALGGLYSKQAGSASSIRSSKFLTHHSASSALFGMYFESKPQSTGNIIIDNCDFEGNDVAIYFKPTNQGSLSNFTLLSPHFEGNYSYAIKQEPGTRMQNLTILNGAFATEHDSMSFATLVDSLFITPYMINCSLAVRDAKQVGVIGAILSNATIPNNITTIPLQGYYEVDVSEAGSITQTIDLDYFNAYKINISNASATGLTLKTKGGPGLQRGAYFQFSVSSGSTAAGTVTFPAEFKTTSVVSFPVRGKTTTIRFMKDAQGVWWEVSRATNAG